MWSNEAINKLRVIYGDQLSVIGEVVVVNNDDNETCQLITKDGEDLANETVYGVGYELGKGGYSYVVLTDMHEVSNNAKVSGRYGYSLRHTSAQSKEYVYKIFNSNFSCVRAGRVKTYPNSNRLCIEVGGKLVVYYLINCRLTKQALFPFG